MFCDHKPCGRPIEGAAYKVTAVDPTDPETAIRRPSYVHWDCLPLLHRSDEPVYRYRLHDPVNGWFLDEGQGYTRDADQAVSFSARDAARLASYAADAGLSVRIVRAEQGK